MTSVAVSMAGFQLAADPATSVRSYVATYVALALPDEKGSFEGWSFGHWSFLIPHV